MSKVLQDYFSMWWKLELNSETWVFLNLESNDHCEIWFPHGCAVHGGYIIVVLRPKLGSASAQFLKRASPYTPLSPRGAEYTRDSSEIRDKIIAIQKKVQEVQCSQVYKPNWHQSTEICSSEFWIVSVMFNNS